MLICPVCEGIITSDKYCSKCGAKQIEVPRCNWCYSYIVPRDNFCGGCGRSKTVALTTKPVGLFKKLLNLMFERKI